MLTPRTQRLFAALLLLLAVILTGCETRWPLLRPAVLPPPAELMEPPTPGSWSESVQQLYKKWLLLLTPQSRA